ncbi:hypothetical protein MMC13_004549 [Lambiella insularis]|nr:hypothetical protein [Lambiella insularis]
MASTFRSQVDAYYELKKSYNELLQAALARQEHLKDGADSEEPLRKDGQNLDSFGWEMPILPALEGQTPSDRSLAAKKVAAMREASEKGKSKVKKSEWAQIDKLLGK